MGDTTRLDETVGTAAATCEHHWVSAHQPDFPSPLYWIKRCSQCGTYDGADLTEQLNASVAEVERLRDELREATKSGLGWRAYVMRERDEAAAERDAALAAVTAVRKRCHRAPRHAPTSDYMRLVADIEAALGTVGKPQDECVHCESTGRCVGSCLDDPREDPGPERCACGHAASSHTSLGYCRARSKRDGECPCPVGQAREDPNHG